MPSDINVISEQNSFIGNLSPNTSFLGTFVDVTDFTTITFTAIASVPPASLAIQFQWSTDKVNIDSTTDFGSDASVIQTVHSVVRARYFRVRYTTGGSGAVNIRLQTLLRKGTIAGSVSKLGVVTGTPDAQIVNSIIFAKNPSGNFVSTKATQDAFNATDFYLAVTPPTNRPNHIVQNINAVLISVELDFFNTFGNQRRWLTVFNNTVRGNLFIKLGGAASLANFDFKVPPQHNWQLPQGWIGFSNTVFGIWDVADGNARVVEAV